MATKVGEAVIIIDGDLDEFEKDMRGLPAKAEREGAKTGKGFGDKFESEGNKSSKGFSTTFLGNLGANLAGNAISSVGAAAGEAFMAGLTGASDLEQSIGGVQAIFGEYAGQIEQSSMSAATSLGLSRNAFNELATVVGAGLKNKGIADYAGETERLMGLGGDLAAQFGGSTKEAMEAISSLMRGEADPIERYGVAISETAVNAELAAKGQDKLTGSALETAKTQARLKILFDQTRDAQGAFAREADTAAGKQARAAAQWEDLSTRIGGIFLPILSDLMGFLSSTVIPGLEQTISFFERNSEVIGGVAAVVGVAIAAWGAYMAVTVGIPAVLGAVRGAMIAVNLAMRANPIGIIITLIAALVAGLIYAYKNSETFRDIVNGVWNGIKATVGAVVGWFTDSVVPFFAGLWETIAGGDGPNIFQRAWGGIKDFFAGLWDGIVAGVTWFIDLVVALFLNFTPLGLIIQHWEPITGFFAGVWEGIKSLFSAALDFITDLFMNWTVLGQIIQNWDSIVGFFTGLWNRVSTAFMAGLDAIWAVVGPWVDWFMGVFRAAWGVLEFLIALPIRLAQIAVTAAWNGIVVAFQTAWSWVSGVFLGWWNSLVASIDAVMASVRATVAAAWTWVTARFAEAWSWISGVFMSQWRQLTALIDAVLVTVRAVVGAAWQWITDRFAAAWTWVSGVFMGWWRQLTGLIDAVLLTVRAVVGAAWTWITDRFTAAWNWVSGVFMGWWRLLTGLIDTVLTAVRNAVGAAWQWITDRFTQAWNWVTTTFRGWWEGLLALMERPIQLAREAIDRILSGIRSAFEQAVNFVRDTWDRIKEIVASPVRIAIRVGNALIGGFRTVAKAVGLDDIAGRLVDIPPLPAFARGSSTGVILPGTAPTPGDNMMVVDSTGRARATIRSGEAIIPEPVTRANRALIDSLIAGRTLTGFFQGGVMPTTAGAVNPHRLPYYGAQWAGDFPRPMGTPVFAWRPGTVAQTMYANTSYGNRIRINHPDGFGSSLSAHLSQIGVQVGQNIAQGARIGLVGSTGNSSGPHLHWERLGSTAAIAATASASGSATGAPSASIFDWVGDLISKFAGPLNELAGLGNSPVAEYIKAVPKMVADGMINKVRDAFNALMSASSGVAGNSGNLGSAGAVTANTRAKGEQILAATRAAGHSVGAVYGYDSNPGNPEHHSGRALDFMVSNKAAGDFIASHVWNNRGRFGLQHVIWWQRIISAARASEGWRQMADRGSATQNHMDHPHVLFSPADVGLDSGGWLQPGLTLANNSSGKPEPVLSSGQWKVVDGILSGVKRQQDAERESKQAGGRKIVQYINIHNPVGQPEHESLLEAAGIIGARIVGV